MDLNPREGFLPLECYLRDTEKCGKSNESYLWNLKKAWNCVCGSLDLASVHRWWWGVWGVGGILNITNVCPPPPPLPPRVLPKELITCSPNLWVVSSQSPAVRTQPYSSLCKSWNIIVWQGLRSTIHFYFTASSKFWRLVGCLESR